MWRKLWMRVAMHHRALVVPLVVPLLVPLLVPLVVPTGTWCGRGKRSRWWRTRQGTTPRSKNSWCLRGTMVQNRKETQNKLPYNHSLSHERGSERSERANEWASAAERMSEQPSSAQRAVRSKQTSEQCEQTSERTSEWPSTYVWVLGWSGPQFVSRWLSVSVCLFARIYLESWITVHFYIIINIMDGYNDGW